MNKVELLAPAGDMESVYAAVQSGANAIYIGGDKFSARAYAHNFDNESVKSVVRYCHLYNVSVYVTINTIIKDVEMKDALTYVEFLYNIGVDAIIVQDIGLAILVKKHFPDFEIHASTQMTIHNLEGALFLESIGFDRIVLSRELSLEEIRLISSKLTAETEVFIHGALCVCYSGQCLMSSMIGGRSGNRGRCAQPCRLPYNIVRNKDKVSKRGYLLSPKDMCTIDNVKDIIESGAFSLKIEGRMKRPEYVAGVVKEYRKAIDRCLSNKMSNKSALNTDKSKKRLLQLFNREGFTKAYLFKNTGRDMMSYLSPRNTGIEIGKVEKDMTVILKDTLSIGDGVRHDKSGFNVFKILKGNMEVSSADKGDRVKIFPTKYRRGDMLYKTADLNQMKNLQDIYKNPYEKKIELNLKVKFQLESPIELETIYDGKVFKVEGDIVQRAIKRPLSQERVFSSLLKTGDSIFKFSNIELAYFEHGFLPISSLNSVRRKLINCIEKYILDKNINRSKKVVPHIESFKRCSSVKKLPEKMVSVTNEEQLRAVLESSLDFICINPFKRNFKIDLENLKNRKVYIVVPNIVKREFEYICNFIHDNINKIEGIITSNLGIINRFKGNVDIIGDYKLNIYNRDSLNFYNNFIDGSCLSAELSRNEVKHMLNNNQNNCQMLVYGRVQVMVSEYCPIGSTFGGKDSFKECNLACENSEYSLIDRKNKVFPVSTDRFCRSYIYNSVPTNLIPNISELRKIGVNSFRIDFIDETYEQAKEIIDSFINEKWNKDFSGFTRGHYKKGIE
ncbi:U32 family peptidase [Clostridium sp. cel8]|uniref:DUF3656 domain-containing U32 family peptidase n=1 Tax=Clostridium sp. cel8 TaxID=2663123 RepID=UPI0015F5C93C|nr:U32 family peptidase [Clostridium sp. cel8]MBA5850890.1 U32 family peptidase [Clostridium sp. cel8]